TPSSPVVTTWRPAGVPPCTSATYLTVCPASTSVPAINSDATATPARIILLNLAPPPRILPRRPRGSGMCGTVEKSTGLNPPHHPGPHAGPRRADHGGVQEGARRRRGEPQRRSRRQDHACRAEDRRLALHGERRDDGERAPGLWRIAGGPVAVRRG